MSARLTIRVHYAMPGAQARTGAVADILPADGEARERAYRGVVIPVSATESKEVAVAPGRYLVRASLPSGAVYSKSVTAAPDTTTEVVLGAEAPRRERLGWHDLLTLRPITRYSVSNTLYLPRLSVHRLADGSALWSDLSRDAPRRGAAESHVWLAQLGSTKVMEVKATPVDDENAVFLLEANGAALDGRYVGLIERGPRVDLVNLPIPWYRADTGGAEAAAVDVAVPFDREGAPTVAVRDPELGPLLGALASGRLPLAWSLSGEGEGAQARFTDALEGKRRNPYAAVAGAYLLLQHDPAEVAPWHPWVKNLAVWFPWLPDGAALYGTLLLRSARDDAGIAAARAAFEDAIGRGVPVFAPVLRLLLDGVTTLVDDPDVDAGPLHALLPKVRGAARVLVLDQALTTLTFGARS